MIERYLHSSKQLRLVFLLIDIRHEPSANDCIMYNWIVENGFHPIIIATKLDKINRSQIAKQIKVIKNKLEVVEGTPIIPFSAETKQGREEIWEMIEKKVRKIIIFPFQSRYIYIIIYIAYEDNSTYF